MSSRRRGVLALAALVALAAFLLLRRPGVDPAAAALPAVPVSAPTAASVVASPPPAPAERATLTRAGGVTVERLEQQYEAYKAGSIYPDWSYPLTPDQTFLTEWNAAITDDLPVDDAHTIFFRFDAAKGRVFVGEPYVSWAEAWTLVHGERKNVPFRIERATVVVTSGPAQGDAFALTYHDDGQDGDVQAGDFRYTNRFVPSERTELSRATMARIEAYVSIGGETHLYLRDFVWSPRPVLDVVGVSDAMKDGSLVATLDCQVHEDGVYTVYGNLFAADGTTTLATSKKTYPLKVGRQKVDLVFFGKVLSDQQVDGPYVLKDVHGLKHQEGDEMNIWWQYAEMHRTRGYAAADFSGEEWNDPERRERLANFEHAIAAMKAGPP